MSGKRIGYAQKQGRRKSLLLLAGVFILLIALWGIVHTFGNVGPLWTLNDPDGVIVATDPMVLFWINQSEEKITAVIIPRALYTPVVHGYGLYQLGRVWKLGEMEGKRGSLVAQTVQEALAVPVVGWIEGKEGLLSTDAQKQVDEAKKRVIFSIFGVVSNLSLFDRVMVAYQLMRFSSSVSIFNLSNSGVLIPTTLPDGTLVDTLDQKQFDLQAHELFEVHTIRTDSLTLEIRNATTTPALGNRVARLASNLGANVVKVSNSQSVDPVCHIETTHKNKSKKLVGVLKRLYQCIVEENADLNEDVVLTIGQNYADFLTKNN